MKASAGTRYMRALLIIALVIGLVAMLGVLDLRPDSKQVQQSVDVTVLTQ